MTRCITGLLLAAVAATAQPLEIVNDHGGISVQIEASNVLEVWRAGTDELTSEGIEVTKSPTRVLVEAHHLEGQSPDITVRMALGLPFTLKTKEGDISLSGMVRRARIESLSGSLSIHAPLDVTSLSLEATNRPDVIDLEPGSSLALVATQIAPRLRVWRLSDRIESRDLVYGGISAQLHSPTMMTVRDWPIPPGWPLKPHTMAQDAVQRLLDSADRRRTGRPAPPRASRRPEIEIEDPEGETALFRSDVRMVSMSVAVSDRDGRPLIGLSKDDFHVEEDGVRQEISVAGPEESPFNLAILLDLSGSTAVDLEHMRQATLRLIDAANPKDKVALYGMSGSMFHRLTPFTSDRDVLAERANRLPYPAGGSPLWDIIALAYDEELASLAGQRNALVVISDGIDNRISRQSAPSTLRAARLVQAAGEMDARIYPIFLLSGQRFGRNWSNTARQRMQALADKTGGRLFTAGSVADIEPVLPELTRELRSVYEIAYYPANQEFDGKWRRVKIAVGERGAGVRARPGYFAE